jgi:hypothetical protein
MVAHSQVVLSHQAKPPVIAERLIFVAGRAPDSAAAFFAILPDSYQLLNQTP